MLKRINYLGLLSLLALIGMLGWTTENTGLFGFFGFLYYIRYFWVVPDELFRFHVQKAATIAFMAEMLLLIPFLFVGSCLLGITEALPTAFGLSFAAAILAFSAALLILEREEQQGAGYD